MISVPAGVHIHLALGPTEMRKGFDGLSLLVQETLRADAFSGHLFVFRGKRAGMLKILLHDGTGMCLFAKRLDQGAFTWPERSHRQTIRTARICAGIQSSISLLVAPASCSAPPLLNEAPAPLAHRVLTHAGADSHILVLRSARAGQRDPASKRQCLRRLSPPRERPELVPLRLAQYQRAARNAKPHPTPKASKANGFNSCHSELQTQDSTTRSD